ncbi:MAG: hypothetical protein A2V83_10190 [Nitrospirae bacterium RBG_16_64_22]|nr:MAG: hypothetical protein A2V83_10190 [Nitrospirae bacterium RBG_16_64_22]
MAPRLPCWDILVESPIFRSLPPEESEAVLQEFCGEKGCRVLPGHSDPSICPFIGRIVTEAGPLSSVCDPPDQIQP